MIKFSSRIDICSLTYIIAYSMYILVLILICWPNNINLKKLFRYWLKNSFFSQNNINSNCQQFFFLVYWLILVKKKLNHFLFCMIHINEIYLFYYNRFQLKVIFWIKLEKKYASALDNYGQSCFVRGDLKKNEVCKTQMIPPPPPPLPWL